jgi:hypothetical protein
MSPAAVAARAPGARRGERRGGCAPAGGGQLSLDALSGAPGPVAQPDAPTPLEALAAEPGRTLDDVLVGAWAELSAHRAVACLVCGAAMTPRYGAAGGAHAGGRCSSCGSSLS